MIRIEWPEVVGDKLKRGRNIEEAILEYEYT